MALQYMYMYVYICVYIYIYIHVYISISLSLYIYIYIYIQRGRDVYIGRTAATLQGVRGDKKEGTVVCRATRDLANRDPMSLNSESSALRKYTVH